MGSSPTIFLDAGPRGLRRGLFLVGARSFAFEVALRSPFVLNPRLLLFNEGFLLLVSFGLEGWRLRLTFRTLAISPPPVKVNSARNLNAAYLKK